MRQNERTSSRTRSPRGKSPSGRTSRWPCKDYLKGTCNNSSCKRWHPPECLFYKDKNGCRFGEKCSFAHRQVDAQPTERSQKNDDKSAVAVLKKGNWQERIRLRCLSRSNGEICEKCRRIMSYTSYLRTNDCTNNGYVTDNLEHNTMINIDTGAHMILHYTQS